jgi:cell division initiation protein
MALSPVEIRHIGFARGLVGYKRSAVEQTLAEVADSFEEVWRERADLADKVEQLEVDISRYRELETLLHTTLVSAERAAADMKEQARREAESIIVEAHNEARAIALDAHTRHARLVGDMQRLKSLLQSALAAVDEAGAQADPADDEPEQQHDQQEHTGDEPWHDTGSQAA